MKTTEENNAAKRSANGAARNGHKFADMVLTEVINTSSEKEEEIAEVIEKFENTESPAAGKEAVRVINFVKEEVKTIPLQEIRERNKNCFIVSEKYQEVKTKAEELREFKLTHQTEQAKIILTDAEGRIFTSSNPAAIEKFISYCSDQFEIKLSELETEIRKLS